MLAAELQDILSGLRHLPRRAVVGPNGLCDRWECPGAPEIPQVSQACEALRRHSGQPTWPRCTASLVATCLADNEPGAWEALRHDLETRDVDHAALRRTFAGSPITAADCLTGARETQHFWDMVRVISAVSRDLDEDTRRRTKASLERVLPVLIAYVGKAPRGMSNREKTQCITDTGDLVAWYGVNPGAVVDQVLSVRVDEVLLLFVHAVTSDVFDGRPDVIQHLLQRATRAPQSSKYPSMALLSLAPTRTLVPFAGEVRALCGDVMTRATSQGGIDLKLAFACGRLVRSVAVPGTLESGLAAGLECVSADGLRKLRDP